MLVSAPRFNPTQATGQKDGTWSCDYSLRYGRNASEASKREASFKSLSIEHAVHGLTHVGP
jgi:hypothetical protein